MKKLFSNLFKVDIVRSHFYYTLFKEYREDLDLWEERKIFFWFISYYIYSISKGDKFYVEKTFFIKNKNLKKYFKFVSLPPIKIGRNEFAEKYKNNKWIVPINYELDLTIP